MSNRGQRVLVLSLILGCGWLAAAGAGIAVWEQAAAIVATGMVFYRMRGSTSLSLGVKEACAVVVAAVGLSMGWTWPSAIVAAIVVGRNGKDAASSRRLALWALLAVPWLAADAGVLGWVFRLSGAWISAGIFHMLGFPVELQGTWLRIEDQPLAVDAACAGIDTLQATLVVGLWMTDSLKTTRGWIAGVALLPMLAWLANTLRISLLGAVAMTLGREAATGWFHTWGGLAVIVCVFAFAAAWVTWVRKWETAT